MFHYQWRVSQERDCAPLDLAVLEAAQQFVVKATEHLVSRLPQFWSAGALFPATSERVPAAALGETFFFARIAASSSVAHRMLALEASPKVSAVDPPLRHWKTTASWRAS